MSSPSGFLYHIKLVSTPPLLCLRAICRHLRIFFSKPAEVVRAEPIFVLKGLEWIDSIFYDKMRVPAEAFVAIACLGNSSTIGLAITNIAVTWG